MKKGYKRNELRTFKKVIRARKKRALRKKNPHVVIKKKVETPKVQKLSFWRRFVNWLKSLLAPNP